MEIPVDVDEGEEYESGRGWRKKNQEGIRSPGRIVFRVTYTNGGTSSLQLHRLLTTCTDTCTSRSKKARHNNKQNSCNIRIEHMSCPK